MKKLLIFLFFPLQVAVIAQNIQLHYDVGRQEDGTKRNYFVGTFELFKPDSLGYTFLFTDFEFNSPDNPRGVSSGYFEISRDLYLPWFHKNRFEDNLGIHVEYNDGNIIYQANDSVVLGENLHSSWLAGLEYSFGLGNLSINAMALYKYTRGSVAPDFQWTIVWFYPLFTYKLSLTGYADLWTQDNFFDEGGKKLVVFYSEPQLWYNVYKHLSIGSECKISKNFVYGSSRLEIFPTLGAKWEF